MKIFSIHTRLSAITCILMLAVLTSCEDSNSPGVEFMPDMYRSPALEPFVDYVYTDSMTSRTPPVGSIPRGFMTYPFENTNEGFEMAGEKLKNPFKPTEKLLKEGQVLYTSFCAHCHGAKGDGAGTIT